jgi:multidrug resistance protein, MATE family
MPPLAASFFPSRDEALELWRLALPVVVVQVGLMTMGVVDSIMVGHLSAAALAAVALGNLYFFNLCMFGLGVLMSLDPVVAQAVGAGDDDAIARGMQRGLVLAALLTIPLSLVLFTAGPVFRALGQPADVVPDAVGYVWREIPGVFPLLAYTVFRQSLQAMGAMRAIIGSMVVGNLLNLGLNWVLIFGHLGAPALGVQGSAWATTISRWLMTAALLGLAWRRLRPHLTASHPEVRHPRPLARMLALGAPIGLQMQLEFGAFAAVLLLMGRLGTVSVAAHQVAINLASLTFMVPLGVSAAGAVLVGRAVGRGDGVGASRASRAALFLGVGFMTLTAVIFLLFPAPLAAVYSRDAGVLAVAATLIPIAGVFQVFDGVQAVASGLLRGLGDTRAPMIVNLLGFWLFGIPVSVYLGLNSPLGAVGLWWGLVVGLAAVAFFLLLRLRRWLRRGVRRVVIDRPAHAGAGGSRRPASDT